MVAFNFQKSHTLKILSGEKFSTIRSTPRCKPGDKLQLYTGLRTRHTRLLKTAECMSVEPIRIYKDRIEGLEIEEEEFLIMEGFGGKELSEFTDFFEKRYGVPFSGYLIVWK